MKKKRTAVVLCAALLCGLFPAAYAAPESVAAEWPVRGSASSAAELLAVHDPATAALPLSDLSAADLPIASVTGSASSAPLTATAEVTASAVPRVSAQSSILLDADTGEVLYGANETVRLPCASTTKVMTALVVLRRLPLDEAVVITDAHTRTDGSRVYYRVGEVQTVRELLYGLLLSSGNDAALALAEAACGSVSAFVEEMNRTASSLGMADTHFCNPSGLPEDGHYSTAADLARLMRAAMQHPVFAEITATREIAVTGRTLVNHNKLLRNVPGVDGGKTGYTKAAGRCLISTAKRSGRRLVAVTLNAPDDWRDHAALYDYGFSLYAPYPMTDGVQFAVPLPVVGGRETLAELTCPAATVWLRPDESVEQTVYAPHFLYAPVTAGEIGRVVWTLNGVELASAPLSVRAPVQEAIVTAGNMFQ